GHVLVEVMLSGAILLFATAGIISALSTASQHVSTAEHDEQAWAVLTARLDSIRAGPTASWLAAVGTTVTPACPPSFPIGNCKLTLSYSALLTDSYSAFPATVTSPQYIEVTASVSYCVNAPCPANART